ncbi:MAG: helix-turn-helix domain-containing protein [Mycobacterium sp.]
MTSDTSFGGLVKQARMALGMSQAALADLVGRSASAIRSWERGSSTPTDESVVRSLAAVLGIDESALRGTVGMPTEIAVDDVEEIGGTGLTAFAEAGMSAPAVAQSDQAPDMTDHVATSHEITWDDVAASVRRGPEPAAPADRTDADLPGEDYGEVTDPAGQRTEPAVAASAADPDPAPELADESVPTPDTAVPDADEPDLEPVRVSSTEGGGWQAPEPLVRAAPAAPILSSTVSTSSRTAMMPTRQPPVVPAERSYLDDPDQMMTYWIRAALTVAFTMFLLVVLFWALGKLGDSIGEVWALIKAGS